jgi:hypothetical protein
MLQSIAFFKPGVSMLLMIWHLQQVFTLVAATEIYGPLVRVMSEAVFGLGMGGTQFYEEIVR